MSEIKSSGTEEDKQDGAAETLTATVTTSAPPSLFSKILGTSQHIMGFITLGNLFKCCMIWMVVSGPLSWLVRGSGTTHELAPSGLDSDAQQHFKLEPIGFSPSMTMEKKYGYYKKDIAMWEAFEKVGHTEQSNNVPNTTHQVPNSTLTPAVGVATEFDDFDSFSQAAGNKSSLPAATCSQASRLTVIVIDLRLHDANIQQDITFVRHAVSFLLGMVRYRRVVDKSTEFEVVVVLESFGGSVSAYGLLAEQLRRLRVEPGITLTISCDQNALSGGYLLASLASSGQLLAAPFASIGSIGVVTKELLNFHDALEKLGIKPIQFQGGQWKAPMTSFGVISEEEVAHMQLHIDSFHDAFREHVRQWRGDRIADYETIASGEDWLGKKAQELGLVDRLITSDEYVDEKLRKGDRVMKLASYKEEEKRGLLGRFLDFVTASGSSEESFRAFEFVKHESESYIVKGLKALQIGVTAMIDFAEK